jgi:hypothetical protein
LWLFSLRWAKLQWRCSIGQANSIDKDTCQSFAYKDSFHSAPLLESRVMLARGVSFVAFHLLILGLALLMFPIGAPAQRHGGGGASAGGGGLSEYGRPDGVDEKDTLKDFHHAMEVQATSQQIADFQVLVKTTENAKAQLQDFLQQAGREKSAAQHRDLPLTEILETVRNGNKKFVGGFSESQKSGLKEILRRLDKADSDLGQEQARLSQTLQTATANGADISAHAEAVDRALTEFSNAQLALGREMSIVLANGQDLAFTLPAVKTPVKIENRTIAITVSGGLSQIEEQNGKRKFKLELNEDWSDLQQNIQAILHAELDSANSCGERIAVRQAVLTPSSPASLLLLQLHYERWSCIRMYGQTTASELAESDGKVEVKLTPAVDKSNTLTLAADFGGIDASSVLADALRSGDLGDDLRDKISRAMLSALRAATNFKTALPPALENSAVIESAQFRDAGAGVLDVVLEGKTEISNEQANLLASQLNQALAGKAAAPQ